MRDATPGRVLSYDDASRVVGEHATALAQTTALAEQTTPLLDSVGRVLARPVLADRDQPPFRRSTRDGFACRASEVIAGRLLRVVACIRAGEAGTVSLQLGQAAEIMTGAPLPRGADCVVMVEYVQRDGDSLRFRQDHLPVAGENVIPQGAEARAGAMILPHGTRLGAAQIGAAAACGLAELCVFARPRVAIVATGDELVEAEDLPLPHQIRNSNGYSLAAQLLTAGAEPVRLPIARDERKHLESVIRGGLDSDLLLLSGGVSVGQYDLVEEVLLSLGAEFFFTGALIQPGKPVVFGRLVFAGRPLYFFGLPGNPVSTMVTFSLFVAPFLSVLCGEPLRGPRFAQARLARDVDVKPGLTRFLPAVLRSQASGVTVDRVAWQGSSDLAGTSRSDCYLVVPADRGHLGSGEMVTLLLG